MKWMCCIIVAMAGMMVGAEDASASRAKAQRLVKEQKWAEAYKAYRSYIFTPGLDGAETAEDVKNGVKCLEELKRFAEFDEFVEEVLKAHSEVPEAILGVVRCYQNCEFTVIRGDPPLLLRGDHSKKARNGYRYCSGGLTERDRVRVLQILTEWRLDGDTKARPEMTQKQAQEFYYCLVGVLEANRTSRSDGWKFQELTDIAEFPDVEAEFQAERDNPGAPVDEEGNPIF